MYQYALLVLGDLVLEEVGLFRLNTYDREIPKRSISIDYRE